MARVCFLMPTVAEATSKVRFAALGFLHDYLTSGAGGRNRKGRGASGGARGRK